MSLLHILVDSMGLFLEMSSNFAFGFWVLGFGFCLNFVSPSLGFSYAGDITQLNSWQLPTVSLMNGLLNEL